MRRAVIRARSLLAPVVAMSAWGGASLAHAQDDASEPALAELAPMRFELMAGTWFARPGGDIRLGVGNDEIDFEREIELRSQDAAPTVEFTMRRPGRFRVQLGVADFQGDSVSTFDGTTSYGALDLTTGDQVRADLEMLVVNADLTWEIYHTARPAGLNDDVFDPSGLTLGVVGGLSYLDVGQVVEEIGVGRESTDVSWAGAYLGGMIDVRFAPPDGLLLIDAFSIEAMVASGLAFSDEGGSIWMVRAGVRAEVTANVDLYLGYRLYEADVESDDFAFAAGLQGLFLGATIRF